MEINIDAIIERLKHYKPKSYINNKDIKFVSSVKHLEKNFKNIYATTLYVGEISNLLPNNYNSVQGNLLIVSTDNLPDSFVTNINLNVIHISDNCILSVFNNILDIFSEHQKLDETSSKLLKALYQDDGIQNIINTSYKIIGNPIFVRDINFKTLSFTQNIALDEPVWNIIISKGYQMYDKIENHLGDCLDELVNYKIPIYLKYVHNENKSINEQSIEGKLEDNKNFLLKKIISKNENLPLSRIWSNIYAGNTLLGQIVVLAAFKEFTENDILLIQRLSETISVELQKNNYFKILKLSKRDAVVVDLLNRKFKNREAVNESLKFAEWNLKYPLQIITLINEKNMSVVSIKHTHIFLKNLFPNSVCISYEGNFVIVYDYIDDKKMYQVKLNKLDELLINTKMLCGISQPFNDLFDINKYYKESLKSIELGKHLNKDKSIFFYNSYILQYIFSLCSNQESLKELCSPSIFKLIAHDNKYKTDYIKSLYSYVMNFKNSSELANLMHIHRTTLYYRISKIEEILDVDLNNIDEFFSIYLSFKILEYLGENFNNN